MQLQYLTWQQVDQYLQQHNGIIIPIGSTEQHGPQGPIGTDALCAQTIAQGVGKKCSAIVAPTLSIGMAQHHLGFAGSITLRPTTLISSILDLIHSLAKHGFRRFFFVNGHGGNIAPLSTAYSELYAERSLYHNSETLPDLKCTTCNWFVLPQVSTLAQKLFGADEGFHATPAETSLVWYAYPETRLDTVEQLDKAPSGPVYDAIDFRKRFPDGRMRSLTHLANIEAGAEFYQLAVHEASDRFEKFVHA